MKILFRFFLIIFSLTFLACKHDSTTQDKIQPVAQVPDSVLLQQADSLYDLAKRISDPKKSIYALNLHLQALAIREDILKNDIKVVNSLYEVSRLYMLDNKYDVADKYLENARRIAEDINAPFSTIYDLYINLASCKGEAKDFPTAISLNQHLVRVINQNDPQNKTLLAKTLVQVATLYHNSNQEEKAIEQWLVAAQVVPSSILFYKISVGYNALKQYEKSIAYVNKAIRQDLIAMGGESENISNWYLWKAFVLLDLNQSDSVSYFLHRTLQLRQKIFGEKSSYTYGAKRGLGEFFFRIHKYDSAVFYHHESLISLIRKFSNHDFFSNPQPEQDETNSDLTQSLVRKAEAVERLYENNLSNPQLLNLSLNTFILADSVFTSYRRNILHDDPLLQQMKDKAIPYSEMIRVASNLLKKKKSMEYFEKIFYVMESSRAIVLQSALSRAVAFGSVGISDSLLNKEKRFSWVRAEVLQKMNDSTIEQSTRDSLNEVLFVSNNREIDFRNELKKVNPSYFSTKYAKLPTIREIRNSLAQKNSVYIEYMWGDSSIYALMISEDTVKLNSIPINEEFRKIFSGYINEFHADPEGATGLERYKNFCTNSSLLYDRLAKDLLNGIDPNAHLIISVDGPLATIPFEALITQRVKNEEVNYRLPYLVLSRPISYAYSAGVLLKQSTHLREGKKLLAFGYAGGGPARATRSGLANLPGTEKEILAIKDVMKNDINQYKLKAEASESAFKQQVSGFDILHLAVHGEGDTLNSLNSRLIFRSETDTVEDGSLYAHELYDLNLSKLDLAVLSACESGVGKQQTGEGLMSIARGFAYAGCPSLVISLWKISDHTSAQVMKSFYNHLVEGEPLDVSLAQAKADYIKGAGEFNSHPFYWAAFLQVGKAEKLDIKKPNWWSWVLVGLGGCLLLYLFKALKKRSSY